MANLCLVCFPQLPFCSIICALVRDEQLLQREVDGLALVAIHELGLMIPLNDGSDLSILHQLCYVHLDLTDFLVLEERCKAAWLEKCELNLLPDVVCLRLYCFFISKNHFVIPFAALDFRWVEELVV